MERLREYEGTGDNIMYKFNVLHMNSDNSDYQR